MFLFANAACVSSYGSVGRLLVVMLEGASLKASDDDGKTDWMMAFADGGCSRPSVLTYSAVYLLSFLVAQIVGAKSAK